ncbi:MAG: CvpA family protein [Burkholderiaceae bacterium]
MNEIDWFIVGLVALSTLVGLGRGMVRELLALAGWAVAVFLALHFAAPVGEWLPIESLGPLVRTLIAAVLIVMASLLGAAVVGALLRSLMVAAKLSMEDRVLGGVFGLVRGVVVIAALVFFAGLSSAPAQGWWHDSIVLPRVEAGVQWILPWLPEPIARLQSRGA